MTFPEIDCPKRSGGLAWVYILQSADGSLYVGQTVDILERCRKHRLGLGSKHTIDHIRPRLVFWEGPYPLASAVARERQLKRWSLAKKKALILRDATALRILSRSHD
jgi:putative endonuclease